jgi:hypothetical protein
MVLETPPLPPRHSTQVLINPSLLVYYFLSNRLEDLLPLASRGLLYMEDSSPVSVHLMSYVDPGTH